MAISKRNTTAALAVLTSANGTARNGANLSVEQVNLGSLSLECISAITTASVLATFKAQVSVDGTNWYDLAGVSVASAAGTGSPVTSRLALVLPDCVHAWPLVRAVATLSGASTAGADTTQVNYKFVQPGGLAAVQS